MRLALPACGGTMGLTDLSQFGDSDLAKPFRISKRHPKVFTTATGDQRVAQVTLGACDALMRGGG
jgi:hypothetical protein